MDYTRPTKKHYGQHFLVDVGYREQLIRLCKITATQSFLEVGPGSGLLTTAIVDSGADLLAVEIDPDLVDYLRNRFARNANFAVLQKDILSCNAGDFGQQKRRFLGNLPYNISTPFLLGLYRWIPWLEDATFMLQREVALRMTAAVGTKNYGRLTVMLQRYFEITPILDVPPAAFDPPPAVESMVVAMRPRLNINTRSAQYEQAFAALVAKCFSQRRKMLRKIFQKTLLLADWHKLSIDDRLRPEMLSVQRYLQLTDYLHPELT